MSKISRRKFIGNAAVAGTGACICGLGGCATFTKVGNTPPIPSDAYTIESNKLTISLEKVAALAKVGGSVKIADVKLPQSLIVARTGDSDYAVVSIKCPHRGAEVEYQHDAKEFRCASLGHSTFKTDGTFIKGFAGKSLTKFTALLDSSNKNRLTVRFS
ncbi:MAG: hypothetical protein WC740_03020 [Verrucomicrobiia bacterium]